MNCENTMVSLGEHARTGRGKGCKRVSDLSWRESGGLRSLMGVPIVTFDLLATGYGQDIIEIGAVRFENCVEAAEFSTFVNPGRDVHPEELEGSGITPEMLSEAPRLSDVIQALDDFIENAVLATHGDSFNVWMLRKAYEKVNNRLNNLTIDTHPCALHLFDVLRRRYPYPDYLMNDFIAPVAEPYRAVESARLCGAEFLMALEEVRAESGFS